MSESEKVNKMEYVPIVAIGPTISVVGGQITGQAMMFQLLIDVFAERGWPVKVYNIVEKRRSFNSRTIGGFTVRRMLDYLKLIPAIWMRLLFSRKCIIYLTTAQSKMGFMRDMFIIWAASFGGGYLICQQFGGNYGGFYNKQSRFIRFLVCKTLNLARRIIVEGDLVKEQFSFLHDYKEKVCCVPNGLPERSIKVAKKAKTYKIEEPFKLIYLSNLIQTKGYWDVLKAVEILRKRRRNVICRFIGKFMFESNSVKYSSTGQACRAFLEYIRDNELSEHVSYDESLLGREKFEAFRESHLFLLPSNYLYEGQPVSVLEAMAHGVVTIATNYRLIPVMVEENHTGLFVPYGEPEAIVEKIEYLMDNPQEYERLSGNSIKRFCECFTAECYVDRMMTVFMEVTEKAS